MTVRMEAKVEVKDESRHLICDGACRRNGFGESKWNPLCPDPNWEFRKQLHMRNISSREKVVLEI